MKPSKLLPVRIILGKLMAILIISFAGPAAAIHGDCGCTEKCRITTKR